MRAEVQIEDAVIAFGDGIDEAVKRISTGNEVRGLVATVTGHDAVSGGAVLNQVAYAYDGFVQLIEDAQAHGGEVDGSTPRVLYGLADGSTGNSARRLLLRTLGEYCARTGFRVWSWVLMGNHYHLFLETPSANLVAGMGNVSVQMRNLSARPEKGLPREVRTWMRRFR